MPGLVRPQGRNAKPRRLHGSVGRSYRGGSLPCDSIQGGGDKVGLNTLAQLRVMADAMIGLDWWRKLRARKQLAMNLTENFRAVSRPNFLFGNGASLCDEMKPSRFPANVLYSE